MPWLHGTCRKESVRCGLRRSARQRTREFDEQPPLGMALQSMAFRIFGDHFAVERGYSLAVFALNGLLIAAIWRRLLPSAYDWLPVLVWMVPSVVTWAVINNMLENTQALFTGLACLALLLRRRHLRPTPWGWLRLQPRVWSQRCWSKGRLGSFRWRFPFSSRSYRPHSDHVSRWWSGQPSFGSRDHLDGSRRCRRAAQLDCRLCRCSSDPIAQRRPRHRPEGVGFLPAPGDGHLAPHGGGGWTCVGGGVAASSFDHTTTTDETGGILFCGRLRRIAADSGEPGSRGTLLCAVRAAVRLGIRGADPACHLDVQIAALKSVVAAAGLLASLLLVSVAAVVATHGSLEVRSRELVRDLNAIRDVAPVGATIGACPSSQLDWGLHNYFQRFYRISLNPDGQPHGGWFLVASDGCTAPPSCQPVRGTTEFTLLQCAAR